MTPEPTELKPCPLCREPAQELVGPTCVLACCENEKCPLHETPLTLSDWNTRAPDPRIKELEEEVRVLKLQLELFKSEATPGYAKLLAHHMECPKEVCDLLNKEGFKAL